MSKIKKTKIKVLHLIDFSYFIYKNKYYKKKSGVSIIRLSLTILLQAKISPRNWAVEILSETSKERL